MVIMKISSLCDKYFMEYIRQVSLDVMMERISVASYTWKDNIRMDRREIDWEGVDWIHLDQYRD